MTLSDFVEKAKATTKKWWKWILGVVIALIVAYVAWRLHKQRNDIDRLTAENASMKEFIKDIQLQAANEKDAEKARQLQLEIAALQGDVLARQAAIEKLQKEVVASQKGVDAAKTWKELEALAKGGKK